MDAFEHNTIWKLFGENLREFKHPEFAKSLLVETLG